jgi:type IV pilus assembly protein PilM
VVGLDLGSTQIRAVEVELDHNPARAPKVVAYGEMPAELNSMKDGEVEDPRVMAHTLRALWKRHKFRSKDVVLGIGNQRVVVRDIELPIAPLPELRASLPYTAQELLPVRAEDCVLDFCPLAVGEATIQGLLVAVPTESVRGAADAVAKAGLTVARVELNAFALARAVAQGDLASGPVGIVDMGAAITTMVVADDGRPRMTRVLPSGGRFTTEALMDALSLPARQAEQLKVELGLRSPEGMGSQFESASAVIVHRVQSLIESVDATFAYYAQTSGRPVGHVVLTGRAAEMTGFGQYLSTALQLPTSLGADLMASHLTKRVDESARTSLALPLGLAWGAAA